MWYTNKHEQKLRVKTEKRLHFCPWLKNTLVKHKSVYVVALCVWSSVFAWTQQEELLLVGVLFQLLSERRCRSSSAATYQVQKGGVITLQRSTTLTCGSDLQQTHWFTKTPGANREHAAWFSPREVCASARGDEGHDEDVWLHRDLNRLIRDAAGNKLLNWDFLRVF